MKLSMTKTIRGTVWVESLTLRVVVIGAAILGLTMGAVSLVAGARATQPTADKSASARGSANQPVASDEVAKQAESSSVMQGEKYEGMLTDTHCNARHSAAIGLSAADCTRAYVHGGDQFALVDGDNVYVLDGDAGVLKKMAGQRVQIGGTLNGNKISVLSVAAGK
jgi:hypothetical protein